MSIIWCKNIQAFLRYGNLCFIFNNILIIFYFGSPCTRCPNEGSYLMFHHNFGNFEPIFNILSPTALLENFVTFFFGFSNFTGSCSNNITGEVEIFIVWT